MIMSSNEDKLKKLKELQQWAHDEIHRPPSDESKEVIQARLLKIWQQQWVANTRTSGVE